MHDQPIPGGQEPRNGPFGLAESQVLAERVVLAHILALHPDRLTVPELVREITAGREGFAERDAIEVALRCLVGAGLLRCAGGEVLPTRAALHFDRLELD